MEAEMSPGRRHFMGAVETIKLILHPQYIMQTALGALGIYAVRYLIKNDSRLASQWALTYGIYRILDRIAQTTKTILKPEPAETNEARGRNIARQLAILSATFLMSRQLLNTPLSQSIFRILAVSTMLQLTGLPQVTPIFLLF